MFGWTSLVSTTFSLSSKSLSICVFGWTSLVSTTFSLSSKSLSICVFGWVGGGGNSSEC